MKNRTAISLAALAFVFIMAVAPISAMGSTPTLSLPPSSLPSITYYINGTENHYTISTTEWNSFFADIIDNSTYVTYNWSGNATQDLIVFDLSYTGLNPYGLTLITALSSIGFPSAQNLTIAFNMTKNQPSLVTSGSSHLSNVKALDSGAFPGFSWSKPRVTSIYDDYRDAAIIVAIFAATFVLYFYFNRKR
ncbi:MAG: hypothetical protein QXN26_07405 [Thermoplasmataceae archaeon]